MKWFSTLTLMLLTSPLLANVDSCQLPPAQTLDAIVRVIGDGVAATGVVIEDGYILTAAHVVDDSPDNLYIGFHGQEFTAQLVAIYPERDLALLVAETGYLTPVQMHFDNMIIDEAVWAVGFPRAGNQLIASGKFGSHLEEGDLHTTAYVDAGESGGGLLICQSGIFKLAGILKGYGAIDRGDHFERLDDYSVAVSVNTIQDFLAASGYATLTQQQLATQNYYY
jgi:hypothetical protein